MGYNSVAVLYNDCTHEIEESGRIGAQIAYAMRRYHNRKRDALPLNFGVGMVISQDHADGEQVVIVSKNCGVRADEANDLGWQALNDMAECLKRHGYTVKPPKKPHAAYAIDGDFNAGVESAAKVIRAHLCLPWRIDGTRDDEAAKAGNEIIERLAQAVENLKR